MKTKGWGFRYLPLALLLLALAPGAVLGDDKVRVAVLDFNTEAVHGTWRWSWSWRDLSTTAADTLTHELVQNGGLTVVERQRLDEVLAEQNLGDSGRVDPSTAAQIGKVLGVQVVVIGSVMEFGLKEQGGKIPQLGKWKFGRGIGAKVVTGRAKLSARLVDTTTAEIIGSYEGDGTHRFGKGEFAGARAGTDWDTGTASKVLAEAVEEIAAGVSEDAGQLDPSTFRGGIEGKIARVDGGKLYLNVGQSHGVRVGDRFAVRSLGEAIIDPDTGEELGREETARGSIEVTQVAGAKLSIAKIVDGEGFAVGDKIQMK